VHPIVFGVYGEVSAGMEVLIGKLADAWALQIAGKYLLDNVLAAEGIAKSILREEIEAACFNAHAHILRGPTKFCQPGNAATGPGREVQQSSRATRKPVCGATNQPTKHRPTNQPANHPTNPQQGVFFPEVLPTAEETWRRRKKIYRKKL
jgi:hypothetical protein